MPSFFPYTIAHWQLDSLEQRQAPSGNHYLVLWHRQVPLAHIWWQHTDDPSTLHHRLAAALEPTLAWYLGQHTGMGCTGWKQQMAVKGYHQLAVWLETSAAYPGNSVAPDNDACISVVICTRNRPLALQECLQSLTTGERQQVEWIVVDNAPDNNQTLDVVNKFPGVKYVLEKRKGLDIARNTGARYAQYDIIAYTDDDVVIPPDWIKHIRSCFADPMTMAVTGLVIPAEIDTEAQYIFEADWGFNKGYMPRVFDHRYFLDHMADGVPAWDVGAGANMAFRKEAFQLAGFFDERLDAGASGCSGDSEIWYRIMAEGWNCAYFPHLYVYHRHRTTLPELRRQLFSYMRGHVSALLVQHQNYGHKGNLRRLYLKMPVYYYYRLKNYLLQTGNRNNAALAGEIKGCISGWNYYRKNQYPKRQDIYEFPESLHADAVVHAQTIVSVVITCYNHGRFLKQAIESVFQQTHRYREIIVIDDDSQDNTASVCATYKERITYRRVARVGLSAARNIGAHLATGDYIVFLDADDFLYPYALELNLYYFEFYKNVVWVSGGHVRVNERGEYISDGKNINKAGDNYMALLEGNYVAMEGTVMYRRSVFFHFHFDTTLASCEDYDLNLCIARHFPVFSHSKLVAAYRQHGNNMSRNKKVMYESAIKVLKRQQNTLVNETERVAFKSGLKNWRQYYRF